MVKIFSSGTARELFRFSCLSLDEFIPVVKFDKARFARPRSMRVTESADTVDLSDKIEEGMRKTRFPILAMLPGRATLPFQVEKGKLTWDEDGYIEAKIDPPDADVRILSGGKSLMKFGDVLSMELEVPGHRERAFRIDFHANDDEDDYNSGEFGNLHCGRIEIRVLGTSQVGARLIANIDALPQAPAGFVPPPTFPGQKGVELSQIQANQYNNCRGVCYATTASRAQKAYQDVLGVGIINMAVSNSNVDYRIAATLRGNDPFMGYGAGGAFARHGFGQTVDNAGVWAGDLRRGALLQRWNTNDASDLFAHGGHSVIFRNYLFDDAGEITGLEYTDYHGGISEWERRYCEGQKTILGVNLLDAMQ